FMARRAELDGARCRLCYVVAEAYAGRAARSPWAQRVRGSIYMLHLFLQPVRENEARVFKGGLSPTSI
ncbi:hypothetical protein A2U01_0111609, partial [Trifolium medium]|nr:hypothetical protein [Trifolium medium]